MKLPPELEFLAPFQIHPSELYRSAIWLQSDFNDTIWICDFGNKENQQINWNITLDDGELLTAPKNIDLFTGLRYFLTSCTRNHNGYLEQTNSLEGAQKTLFRSACQVIDYLLLNSDRFKLSTYGLEGLTEGNLIEILESISSHPSMSESVYNWSSSLRKYCLDLLSDTDALAIAETLNTVPQLSIVTDEQIEDENLGIPHALIPKVRAALYLKNLYLKQSLKGNYPNAKKISKDIYKNTIWGQRSRKPLHSILCYQNDVNTFLREYPGAPVRSGEHETMNESNFSTYRRLLYNLGTLHEIGVPAPTFDALIGAVNYSPKLSPLGRYRTLPSSIVFNALRQAIEFHLEHGEQLTRAMCRIAIECKKRSILPSSLTNEEVCSLVGSKLVAFGIQRLSLSARPVNHGIYATTIKGEHSNYFMSLRSNHALIELIFVYLGGVQLTVGVLMARRISELYTLSTSNCLDESESFLVFKNSKSTRHLFGARRKEARPIEPIAVDMIKTLIRMQKILRRIGYIPELQGLFSTPHPRGSASLTNASVATFNRNIDFFCDYFETPLNAEGERYYLRQHQLRRFFAMLFFYCSSFSKLDTLQWMLGHTDPMHVYQYITESTDGAVLAGAKAHYVAEQLNQGNFDNFLELAELLQDRYGTQDFSLIDTHDLEDQIHDLMKEGWVEIEPEFFTGHQGKRFKVVARLIRGRETA